MKELSSFSEAPRREVDEIYRNPQPTVRSAVLLCTHRQRDLHVRRKPSFQLPSPCPGLEDASLHSFYWYWDLLFNLDFVFRLKLTVKIGQSCQISLVSLEERSVCKAMSNRRKCCNVMQFPCDSYSEILKTTMNEFFNFEFRRRRGQKCINRIHYVRSELVVQLACQPPKDRFWRHGEENRRHFWNLLINDLGK